MTKRMKRMKRNSEFRWNVFVLKEASPIGRIDLSENKWVSVPNRAGPITATLLFVTTEAIEVERAA